jgi:hypothetical protein
MRNCPHNVIRRKRKSDEHDEQFYVCGSCAKLFEVKEITVDPPTPHNEPMFDRRPPWGFRERQA